MSTAGGLVARFDAVAALAVGIEPLAFLPGRVARRVALASGALALGGAPPLTLGLAVVEGRLLTLVAIGQVEPRGPVAICARPEGNPFALGAMTILATGVFEATAEGVMWGDARVPELDVVGLFARIESAAWVLRAGQPPGGLPPPSSPFTPSPFTPRGTDPRPR